MRTQSKPTFEKHATTCNTAPEAVKLLFPQWDSGVFLVRVNTLNTPINSLRRLTEGDVKFWPNSAELLPKKRVLAQMCAFQSQTLHLCLGHCTCRSWDWPGQQSQRSTATQRTEPNIKGGTDLSSVCSKRKRVRDREIVTSLCILLFIYYSKEFLSIYFDASSLSMANNAPLVTMYCNSIIALSYSTTNFKGRVLAFSSSKTYFSSRAQCCSTSPSSTPSIFFSLG